MNNISEVKDKCTGCSVCVYVCPSHAISLKSDDLGFYYPQVNSKICSDCGACLKKCHVSSKKNVSIVNLKNSEKYYGYSLDDDDRRRSSSGAIFTAITKAFPKAIVIGAEYIKEDHIVKHTMADISNIRRSKYVESYVGDSPHYIKNALENNQTVIFCGTPCQVAGIRILFPDASNLILIDFICHGVPSMKFLNEHISQVEKKKQKSVDDINFRSKTNGWSKQGILYYFKNGEKEFDGMGMDSYLYGFFSNITLRESCYKCKYSYNSYADITLADFWGVYQYDKKLNDEKGLSLFFVNTNKGNKVFNSVQNGIYYKSLRNEDINYIFNRHNYSYGESVHEEFIERYEKYGFEKAIFKYYKRTYIKEKTKEAVKRLLR